MAEAENQYDTTTEIVPTPVADRLREIESEVFRYVVELAEKAGNQ